MANSGYILDHEVWPGRTVKAGEEGLYLDEGAIPQPEKLVFNISEFSDTELYSAAHLQWMSQFFFQSLYCCGDMIKFSTTRGFPIIVRDAHSHTYVDRIRLNQYLSNPLIFIQEIIHVALQRIDTQYNLFQYSDTDSLHQCSQLLVTSDMSPGIYLDARFRLLMQREFISEQSRINYGKDYFPYSIPFREDIYPSLSSYCGLVLSKRKSVTKATRKTKKSPESFVSEKLVDEYSFLKKNCLGLLQNVATPEDYVNRILNSIKK